MSLASDYRRLQAARSRCALRLRELERRETAAQREVLDRRVRLQQVLRAVAQRWRLRIRDIIGGGRLPDRVLARQVVMWWLREREDWSMADIAGACGRTAHGTVGHAIRRVLAQADTDPDLSARLQSLATELC